MPSLRPEMPAAIPAVSRQNRRTRRAIQIVGVVVLMLTQLFATATPANAIPPQANTTSEPLGWSTFDSTESGSVLNNPPFGTELKESFPRVGPNCAEFRCEDTHRAYYLFDLSSIEGDQILDAEIRNLSTVFITADSTTRVRLAVFDAAGFRSTLTSDQQWDLLGAGEVVGEPNLAWPYDNSSSFDNNLRREVEALLQAGRTTIGFALMRAPSESSSGFSLAGDIALDVDHEMVVSVPEYTIEPTTCNGKNATKLGTPGNDVIFGTSGADVIVGLGGNDTIIGLGGKDIICGGSGNDTIDAGNGADWVSGGSGDDILTGASGRDTIMGGEGNDKINGNGDRDHLYGDSGTDTIHGGWNDDYIYGGSGNDYLYGGKDNDRIYAGSGNDYLYGGDNGDYLYGETGNDTIYGEGGKDKLNGGSGTDYCNGGPKNDTYTGCP